MVAIEGRIGWRKTAPFHVQFELDKSHGVPSVLGQTRVEGRVIRVFRTDGRLAIGDHVAFSIWVCEPGDEPTGPAYIYFSDLNRAEYMETYLHGTLPEYKLAAYEFSVIKTRSEQPYLTVEELENLLPGHEEAQLNILATPKTRRFWQFWKSRVRY